jgi:NAD(P)-dependent dehydrogenase (short-subunit alcohol dehydrogenase family)
VTSTIVVTGASSGFGAMTVPALADAGHTVYAGMRGTTGRNESAAADAARHAGEHAVDLRVVELDVSDQASVDAAVARIVEETGRLDVVVHNAGHMVLGPTEAFTPEQLAAVYDTDVLSTQRVNRAALPHLRAQGDGLLVWVGSSSTRGGTPPYLAAYFAAKAAEDSLAVSYAAELACFGIETTIVVPGSFTTGTNHFANAGSAGDTAVAEAYESRYAGLVDQVGARWPSSHRPTPTRRRWPGRSRPSSTCRGGSGPSGCTSTRPTTAPKRSTRSAIGSARSSTRGSA